MTEAWCDNADSQLVGEAYVIVPLLCLSLP